MTNEKKSITETLAAADDANTAKPNIRPNPEGGTKKGTAAPGHDPFAKKLQPENILARMQGQHQELIKKSEAEIEALIISIEVTNGIIADAKNSVREDHDLITKHQAIIDASKSFLNTAKAP